jgi:pimeloyl-ACP methyl ester carboxylesterase
LTSQHHWFRSGSYTLLAHLDAPTVMAQSGVVIVSPFGWEDICSYRPMRSLAHKLVGEGIATLRFDLPGTGDSSGSALDPDVLNSWIVAVNDAVSVLRSKTGIENISVIGVRLGAMLALAAASVPGTHIKDLILWGASFTGRNLLRELRAFRNLEVTEYAEGEIPPPAPIDGLEIAGFLLNKDTERALEAFTVANCILSPEQRILMLSRDNFPHEVKLVQHLEKLGCPVTQKVGMGYQKMMSAPHEPLFGSEDTVSSIAEFLKVELGSASTLATNAPESSFQQNLLHLEEAGIKETIFLQPYQDGSLFSVLSEPSGAHPESEWCLLFMNAGGVRHIGPNRMWVEAARRWASRGVPSVRVDCQSVGESDGDEPASTERLHRADLLEQLNLTMEAMRSRYKCSKFIAVGLCSGAFVSFQSIIQSSAIRTAVLLNPRLFFWDETAEPRRLAGRVGSGINNASYWGRLVRGQIHVEQLKQAARAACTRLRHTKLLGGEKGMIPAALMTKAWKQIERFKTRVTLVFADGEPLIQEMVDERQLPPSNNPLVQIIRIGKTGHTFRALWAQKALQDLLDREVSLAINGEAKTEHKSVAEELSTRVA